MSYNIISLAMLAILGFADPIEAQPTAPTMFVSIQPQRFFMQQICGELAHVEVMVPPGASPATYEPKPRQMAELSRATLYFAVGVPFEQVWLPKLTAANPNLMVVHTDQGIAKLPMVPHAHDLDGKAQQGPRDPHIWLSPPLVKIQAQIIKTALIQHDPAHAAIYQANYDRFNAFLDLLHAQIGQTLSGLQGTHFMVFHPSWGYFAHTYGLIQIPIETEGKAPKAVQLQQLIDQARRLQIKVIFAQPQFATKSARMVATAIGGQVIPADPLSADWAENLRSQANRFRSALR